MGVDSGTETRVSIGYAPSTRRRLVGRVVKAFDSAFLVSSILRHTGGCRMLDAVQIRCRGFHSVPSRSGRAALRSTDPGAHELIGDPCPLQSGSSRCL
jgi:hypothetical protein